MGKESRQDKIDTLLNRLESLKYDLEQNEMNQAQLNSEADDLEEAIADIEEQLDNLDADFE